MYQSADLSLKIAVEIAGCAFAYFWGGQKYNGRLQLRSSFKKNFFQKAFEKKKNGWHSCVCPLVGYISVQIDY